jgi:hypothetical protein
MGSWDIGLETCSWALNKSCTYSGFAVCMISGLHVDVGSFERLSSYIRCWPRVAARDTASPKNAYDASDRLSDSAYLHC